MKSAIAYLVGTSPYSQGKHIDKGEHPMKAKELHDAYEKRTWRSRMHVTKDGHVEIPGSAFALAIKGAAARLRLRVPGKGQTEYKKYFEAGIMCPGRARQDSSGPDRFGHDKTGRGKSRRGDGINSSAPPRTRRHGAWPHTAEPDQARRSPARRSAAQQDKATVSEEQ